MCASVAGSFTSPSSFILNACDDSRADDIDDEAEKRMRRSCCLGNELLVLWTFLKRVRYALRALSFSLSLSLIPSKTGRSGEQRAHLAPSNFNMTAF